MLCDVLNVARSSVYAASSERCPGVPRPDLAKRGPKTPIGDEVLVEKIRKVLEGAPFHGEGHRKVRARLKMTGVVVSRKRVLRLMRKAGLLAPVRFSRTHGNKAHDGKIVSDRPNKMWGTDATNFFTEEEGWCWLFLGIDHYSTDVVGWNAAKVGDRFAALEPIRQGVAAHIGPVAKDVARGLALRHDWGPQYRAREFRAELKFLGIDDSPAYVGEPECNGLSEWFMKIVKEQCLHLHRFKNLAEARIKIAEFIRRYNEGWILARHEYQTPAQARRAYLESRAA